jgi:hypothetical protein
MNENMKELTYEYLWLNCFNEPLKEMRRQLQSEIAADEDKTGD